MNFADAIRKAALNSGAHLLRSESAAQPQPPPQPQPQPQPKKPNGETKKQPKNAPERPQLEVIENPISEPEAPRWDPAGYEPPKKQEFAVDPLTAQPVELPTPPAAPIAAGNVVRLELFLTPEQLNSLFRAVVATQHSVMTLREAATYLRVSPSTLETMAHEGQIPAFLIDGRWRFARNSVDEWLNMKSLSKEMEA